MVVATIEYKPEKRLPLAAAAAAGDLPARLEIGVADRPHGVEAMWRQLEAVADATVYQRYDWVDASLTTLDRGERRSAFIVTATLDGDPAFLLPLCIGGSIVRTLNWVGGNHANYSLGLFAPEFLRLLQPGDLARIMGRIRTLVPGIGVIQMCCQPVAWNGMPNPMLELGGQRAVNRAFVMDLRGGFEALLKRGNAKRRRKKFRFQENAARAAGGYRLVMPATPTVANRILGEFLAQKSERLRSRGLRDVFASGHAREFLSELIRRSAELNEPLLRLFALEVDGKIRAVIGGGVHRNRLSAYFSSIALDDFTAISPGEMLLYLVVRQCASEGMTHIDLGAGEERYKRSWCNETLEMFDVVVPTSLPGIPIAAAARANLAMKRVVRETPLLWTAVGKARSLRRLIQR